MVAESIGSRETPWTIGSVIGTAGSIWARYFVTFVGTALISHIPNLLFQLLVRSSPAAVGVLTWGAVANMVINLIVYVLVIVTLTYGAVQALRGRQVTISECLRQGIRRLPVALGAGILAYIGIVVGTVLLIVPGLILLTMWAVALPAATVERTGVTASLSRSSALTRGRRWRVFGTILIPLLIIWGVGILVVTIFGVGGIGSPLPAIIGWLAGALAQAFNVCVFATLYYFLRREKEGVDIDQIAAVFD
jgi:hypothetical protein